ncbi:MAG TPA: hypothetical protein VK539_16430 [Myxococcaceae bacterium]|jgi:hypothetical protein|nr:hypothetical protein [Myxococcaceae bacterium]
MESNANFDIDAVFRALETVNAQYQEGSPEDEAVRVAAVALYYVCVTRQLDDYRKYFQKLSLPAASTVTAAYTFATREEAETWLTRGGARDGELVKIANQGFLVITLPQGLRFLRNPLPEELEAPSSS